MAIEIEYNAILLGIPILLLELGKTYYENVNYRGFVFLSK